MSRLVLLDSGPLGLVTNPKASLETEACNLWLESLLATGTRVGVPAIADYEVRRELLRAKKTEGLERLDHFIQALEFVDLTTPMMRRAAQFWARARQMGKPTASDAALDGDMILSAQASLLVEAGEDVCVATVNVKHLSLFVQAREWRDIS
jgi:predicted nucleic acid-binding protein